MVTEAGPYRLGRRGLRPGDAWEPLFPEWSQQTIAAGWAADGSVSAVVSMDPVSNERTMWLVFGGKDAEPRSFIEGPTQMSRPAVSPDGRAVAVASNESGAMEVYAAMISSDSTAPTLFQVSERGGRRPIWSRDGTELIFYDPGGYLMSARVRTGGQGLGFERPEVVLDLNALNLPPVYDVSPDGTRFVFAQRAPEEREAGSRIFVELGWGFEFDALMGSKD